ncbi:MAG: DNA-binding transcriptional regulator [Verrucomicrobiota bacterium]|nr:DNA-binding transcriptional regulator [Verrucomicrobiota bacterium]
MKPYRVALLIEEEREIGRSLLRGIAQYSRVNGPWIFYREVPFYERLTHGERLQWIKDWRADGIIMREQGRLDAPLLELGIPVIYSGHRCGPAPGIPNILGDDRQIGTMAADYLIGKGFRSFGFCGFRNMWWSEDRGRFFAEHLQAKGFGVNVYPSLAGRKSPSWSEEPDLMADWIKTLSKPCAVFACTDDRCRQLSEACKRGGVKVPEEVALLGVDNDELVCDFASPPLSSIMLNAEKTGYDAAAVLHRMMQGEGVGEITIPIPAPRVVTRQSTDIMAIDDPIVANALNHIREHYRKGIAVTDIARAAGVSRRVLELHFRKSLDRSVYEEVLRLRMNHACTLLIETNLSVAQVAEALDYDEIKYFSRGFRKVVGLSPLAYRKQHSIRD